MIITRTPFRVSFVGGGSDLKDFYSRNGYGAVVSAAIRSYMYIAIHPYFQDKIRIKYSKTEDVDSVGEIQHPIVRECLKKVKIERGIEIASFADVPSGTGLGSSSSFTVGLLNALYVYKGVAASKERLAREACEIEIDLLGEPIGKQDQYAAAYGDLNYIRFNGDGTVDVSPQFLPEEDKARLERRLCLYYAGGSRKASAVLAEQKMNMARDDSIERLKKMVGLADEMREDLNRRNVDKVGEMLHRAWACKKELAGNVTNHNIDALYERALSCGAEGGKILGAGSTGFMLLFSKDHARLRSSMPEVKSLPFSIDREGTKIIFYG